MPVISFRVTAEQQREAADYARRKGFAKPGPMARVAMLQMMARYPLRKGHGDPEHGEAPAEPGAVQPAQPGGSGGEGRA